MLSYNGHNINFFHLLATCLLPVRRHTPKAIARPMTNPMAIQAQIGKPSFPSSMPDRLIVRSKVPSPSESIFMVTPFSPLVRAVQSNVYSCVDLVFTGTSFKTNALVQIGTPAAEEALSRCLAQMDTRWDVALLGALGLLIFHLNRCGRYAPLDIPGVGEVVQYCWDKVGGIAVLEFLENFMGVGFASGLSAELMKDSPELTSSRGIIGLLLQLIPGPKLRTSALELLEQDKYIEFTCSILSKVGRREDLPLLRSKLWNRSFHHIVQATIDRINEMLLADEFSE